MLKTTLLWSKRSNMALLLLGSEKNVLVMALLGCDRRSSHTRGGRLSAGEVARRTRAGRSRG